MGDGPPALGGQHLTPVELTANPYLLCEQYVPAVDLEKERSADLDREQRTDGPIDYFTVDIGMFQDSRYLERNDEIQDLTVAGPERLRAFSIEALRRNEGLGHSFFYRDKIALRADQFLSPEARALDVRRGRLGRDRLLRGRGCRHCRPSPKRTAALRLPRRRLRRLPRVSKGRPLHGAARA
jgi:hypothetical protein